jgi:hypothetical protein
MTEWEYIRVFAEGRWDQYDGGRGPSESQQQATERWYSLLNERGSEGWELVVERHKFGGESTSSEGYWSQYTGTMKRPRQSAD